MREEYEQSDAFQEFNHLLWWMFQDNDGPRYQVKVVAPELNVNPDSLYRYIRGALPFPAHLIPDLYRATREKRLLNWIGRTCGLKITEIETSTLPDGDVTDDLDEVMIASFNLFEAKVRAFRDGEITSEEKHELFTHGVKLADTLNGLLAELSDKGRANE
jgi:hypothetical protein